jgi:preprotein translocase subunit SecD
VSRRSAILTLTITLAVVYGSLILTQISGTTPLLGLDLQGGFSVVLNAPEGTETDVLDQAVQIMRRRIEALGNVQEPEIAVVGERSIEIAPCKRWGPPGVSNFARCGTSAPSPG